MQLNINKIIQTIPIPSAGSVLREADRARTPECVWSRSLDPIDSIGRILSITVGRIVPAEGIIPFEVYVIQSCRDHLVG